MNRLIGLILVCAAGAGCGGPRANTSVVGEERAGGSGVVYEAVPGPVAPVPVVETAARAEPVVEDRKDEVKREADDLLMREDGRPSWWFGEPLEDSVRIRVCAEALGGDMRDAKRAAVEIARVRMRRELGLGPATRLPDELIERTWVWPLAHAETPGARYAGYVLVSVSRE